MQTLVAPVKVGEVVKVIDQSQFQRVVHIGAVNSLQWDRGQLYAKVQKWSVWVPVNQLVPVRTS